MEGEEKLREFCEAQRPELMKSAAETIEALSTILPEVDKRALTDSADVGAYMEQSTSKSIIPSPNIVYLVVG